MRMLWCTCVLALACANPAASRSVSLRRVGSTANSPKAAAAPVRTVAPAAVTEPAALEPVVIVAGGDVSFAREVGQRLIREHDFDPLQGVQTFWRDADVRFVNLESQLSFQNGETQSPNHRLIFTGPPEGAAALARAKITLVSTANNHAWDYGRSALLETLTHLSSAGVLSVGTGVDLDQAMRVVTIQSKGMRIAWLAVTHVWNQGPIELHEGRDYVAWAKLQKLEPIIARARRDHDFVILSYHGGAEYQDAPADVTRRFVNAAFDAGVDLVIGHHPHVIQGVGFRDGRAAFFSLGNLVFGVRPEHPWTRFGMLAKITLRRDGTRAYAACPYRIGQFTPEALASSKDQQQRDSFLSHVKSASTAVGGMRWGDLDAAGCAEVLPPLTPRRADPPRVDPEVRPLARR